MIILSLVQKLFALKICLNINDDLFEAYLEEYVRCIKEFISNMQHVFDKYSLATWIQNNPYNFKKWAVDEDTCELFRLV